MTETLQEVVLLPIDEIMVDNRHLNEQGLPFLAESISKIGLLHPVGVTRDGRLIHGRHRLEAYRQLGRDSIPAVIYDWDSLTAELAGIDENLCQRTQEPAEIVRSLARRKQLYLAIYPQSGHGKNPGKKGGGKKAKADKVATFAEDTAAKTGKSKRSVQRDAAIGAALPDEILDLLVGTKVSKKDLAALAKLDPQVQRSIAEMLSNGEIDSVQEALQGPDDDAGTVPAPEPSQVLLERLRSVTDAWIKEFSASRVLAAAVLENLSFSYQRNTDTHEA